MRPRGQEKVVKTKAFWKQKHSQVLFYSLFSARNFPFRMSEFHNSVIQCMQKQAMYCVLPAALFHFFGGRSERLIMLYTHFKYID